MQQFDVIADYQDLCGEGPVWNKDSRPSIGPILPGADSTATAGWIAVPKS